MAYQRAHGRAHDALRPLTIARGYTKHAEGSVLICFGDTKVLCTATVEERVPPHKRGSGEGWVTAEYGMLPRSTHTRSDREAARGKQGGRTLEIQRLIGRSLRAVMDMRALGERTLVMGVLNVTPDSFSDGGRFMAVDAALAHARQMVSEGARIIDVGAESTRPGAVEVSGQEELDRILPVVERIATELDVVISVDTSTPAVMREAAAHFVGEHDFAAFRTAGCAARTTVRRIDAVEVTEHGEFIRIDVVGSGFLRNMVRIMAGTLVGVGQGKLPPDVVAALLAGPGGVSAGATAPSHGLCLMEVYY